MLDKSKQVHRPERLKGYDYSQTGCYFITLTTKARGENIFCSIEGDKGAEPPVGPAPLGRPILQRLPDCQQPVRIRLTLVGEIVRELIERIPAVYQDAAIDCYAIMPDHVHLLLWLGQEPPGGKDSSRDYDRKLFLGGRNGPARGPGPTSVPKIVNALKSLTTRQLGESVWRKHYYEHIIRNGDDLNNTRQYIRDNPLKWVLNQASSDPVP